MEPKDRRLQERFSLDIQAIVTAETGSDGESIVDKTSAANISSGGAFLTTHLEIPLASRVYVEFLVTLEQLKKLRFVLSADSLKKITGNNIWVKATGVVIRVEDTGIAIIFDQDYQLTPMDAATKE
ncbi:MAG: hypothetical protein V2I36_18205 [Desulfopila sp.]|jgi:hypothetical protein|nr:hypothetical protein [Desulfopila sp.]